MSKFCPTCGAELDEAGEYAVNINHPRIEIQCVYFKKSGKYYTEDKDEYSVVHFEDCIYPRDYGRKLQAMKRLPGLQGGTWLEGYFTVTVQDKGTELVVCG